MKKNCWSLINKKVEDQTKEIKAKTTYEEDVGALALSTREVTTNDLVLDSKASFHATSCREYFKNHQADNFDKVYFNDDEPYDIIGKGDVLLKLKNVNNQLLKDVRHVPQLKRNMVLTGQLIAQRCITFESSVWKVTKGALVIAIESKSGTLYVLEGQKEVGVAMAVVNSRIQLCPKRLGQMNKKGLEILHKKNQLQSLKSIDLELCEHCIYGKQKNTRFSTKEHEKKSRPLELVHSNVCGPSSLSQNLGAELVVVFVDEFALVDDLQSPFVSTRLSFVMSSNGTYSLAHRPCSSKFTITFSLRITSLLHVIFLVIESYNL